MIKTLTLFLLLIAAIASAQVTVHSGPAPGDFHTLTECDTNGINEGSGGATAVWNFNSLNPNGSTFTINYVNPASTPHSGTYPAATVSAVQGSNYTYFQNTSAELQYLGSQTSTISEVLTNYAKFSSFPFTFGGSINDNFSGTSSVSGFNAIRTGTVTVTGDGHGILHLHNGTHTALRVKTVLDIKDSAFVVVPIVTRTVITTYSWYISTRKYPILTITRTAVTAAGNTTRSKRVDYSPNSTVGITSTGGEIPTTYSLEQNYPNPFNPSTKIRFALPKAGIVSLSVFNSAGVKVTELINGELQAGSYEMHFNATALSSGVYYCRLNSGEFNQTRKMILVK